MESTFRGALCRFPSHSAPPWSRMVVADDRIRLLPRFTDAVEFRRDDVRRIDVRRYRGPFVFCTLLWIVTSKRHTHAFVPVRSTRLIEALRSAGWPVVDSA